MRNLTHLRLNEYVSETKIGRVIGSCPNLRLIVILTQGNRTGYAVEQVSRMAYSDARVVECCVDEYESDWLRGGGLVKGQDSWEFAEEVMVDRMLALRVEKALSAGIRH